MSLKEGGNIAVGNVGQNLLTNVKASFGYCSSERCQPRERHNPICLCETKDETSIDGQRMEVSDRIPLCFEGPFGLLTFLSLESITLFNVSV